MEFVINHSNIFLVSKNCFPQTIDIIKTRANSIGIELEIIDPKDFIFKKKDF